MGQQVMGQQQLECKRVFGEVRGAEIVELVERTTGEPCPCKKGHTCPLLATAVVSIPVAR